MFQLKAADFAFHSNGNIYIANKNDGKLYEINPSDGNIISRGSLGFTKFNGANVGFFDKDDNFYLNNSQDGWIYKIDLSDPLNHSGVSEYRRFNVPREADGARCLNAGMETVIAAPVIEPPKDIIINAKTTNSAGFDGNITTQIVKQNFNLTVVAYDKITNSPIKDMAITRLEIVQTNGTVVTFWSGSKMTNANGETEINIKSDKAIKIANIKIYGNYKGKDYNNQATDDFAIRPASFTLDFPTKKIAGEPFLADIKAVDATDNPTQGYNETSNSSFKIYNKDKLAHCLDGVIDLSGINFSNGSVSGNVKYSEVGEVDFNISEIPGQEFALVDADDTTPTQRFISSSNIKTMEFTVADLKIKEWALSNGDRKFTYFANETDIENMGAELNVTIEAINMDGNVTKNYKSGCYAKDVELNLDYSVYAQDAYKQKLIWQEDAISPSYKGSKLEFNGSHDGILAIEVNSTKFNDGLNTQKALINFDREINQEKNPLRFTAKELKANNIDVAGTASIEDKIVDFYYGRMHVPDYDGSGEKHNIVVFHEVYCKKCNKGKFTYTAGKESSDAIFWYILKKEDYVDNEDRFEFIKGAKGGIKDATKPTAAVTVLSTTVTPNNKDLMTFKIPNTPFRDRIIYEPSHWLVFNRFSDTKVRQSFILNITASGNWSGKGKAGQSVDGASTQKYNKMDW